MTDGKRWDWLEAEQGKQDEDILLSFVVIGLNEGQRLRGCITSVVQAQPEGISTEIIYVDGGSSDESEDIAEAAGANLVLGTEERRSAAENRNVGWRQARGQFVQFLDAGMRLAPEWPRAALELLEKRPDVGVVFGRLREERDSVWHQALQIDREYPEGTADYCGGAAMFRRKALEQLGGFPEDMEHGEGPYLCWRLRNELRLQVYHLHADMARHDSAYRGFIDYWRRTVRVGATYAEVASKCQGAQETLWHDDLIRHALWGWGLFLALIFLLVGGAKLRALIFVCLALLLARKAWQQYTRGHSPAVSWAYAGHTYLAKLAIAWGIIGWKLREGRRRR